MGDGPQRRGRAKRARVSAPNPSDGAGLAPPAVLARLAAAYGPQRWWPAHEPFEMMAGALLVQRTSWRNAARAVARLRGADAMSPEVLSRIRLHEIEALIRPAGTFRTKAARLQGLARWYVEAGGVAALAGLPTATLRSRLLERPGIGPETADDILVYVFERPVFVVDAYARRILTRCGWASGDEPYDTFADAIVRAIGPDAAALGELHALLVEHGKRHCRPAPHCTGCPLAARCGTATGALRR